MSIEKKLSQSILQVLSDLYGQSVDEKSIQLQATRKEFDGDLTLVVFPFLKISKKTPELTAEEIGSKLKEIQPIVENYNVIKGFLNLTIAKKHWVSMLNDMAIAEKYGFTSVGENSPLYMVEYSSPNTNKPLHLGHVRNNLLGYSLCRILEANGFRVVKTNIVNDRGIHICKSMLAWKKFGNGETPESSGKKGDHLVGDYYVKFDLEYKAQVKELMSQGKSEEEAKKEVETDYDIKAANKYGIPLDKKVFIYGGNLGRPQGIPFIIECLKTQVNNLAAYFLIVGDGTEYGKLNDYFAEAKPKNMKLMQKHMEMGLLEIQVIQLNLKLI